MSTAKRETTSHKKVIHSFLSHMHRNESLIDSLWVGGWCFRPEPISRCIDSKSARSCKCGDGKCALMYRRDLWWVDPRHEPGYLPRSLLPLSHLFPPLGFFLEGPAPAGQLYMTIILFTSERRQDSRDCQNMEYNYNYNKIPGWIIHNGQETEGKADLDQFDHL